MARKTKMEVIDALAEALGEAQGKLKPYEIARVCGNFLYHAGYADGRCAEQKITKERAHDAATMDPAAFRRKHGRWAEPPKARAAKAGQ